jgi:hypothetical protein
MIPLDRYDTGCDHAFINVYTRVQGRHCNEISKEAQLATGVAFGQLLSAECKIAEGRAECNPPDCSDVAGDGQSTPLISVAHAPASTSIAFASSTSYTPGPSSVSLPGLSQSRATTPLREIQQTVSEFLPIEPAGPKTPSTQSQNVPPLLQRSPPLVSSVWTHSHADGTALSIEDFDRHSSLPQNTPSSNPKPSLEYMKRLLNGYSFK